MYNVTLWCACVMFIPPQPLYQTDTISLEQSAFMLI
jgi:hypothetical protein